MDCLIQLNNVELKELKDKLQSIKTTQTATSRKARCQYTAMMLYGLPFYQPMTVKAVMSSHKPIRIYMGALILGIILFCFLKLFLMVSKELVYMGGSSKTVP